MSIHWITGGKGFIGQNLSRRLSGHNNTVIGLGHGNMTDANLASCGLSGWLNSSVSAPSLELLRAQYGLPEVVFHLAGGSAVAPSLRAPHEDFDRTVRSTAVLLEWLRLESPDTAVVYVSSAAVYGTEQVGPIAESAPAKPYSPYGFHKYCAELLVQEYACNYGLPATIVRLFSVYGPGLRKQLLWDLAQRLHAHPALLELGGTGDEVRDWLFIDDAVDLLARAAGWASRSVPIVNGGTGTATTVQETVSLLITALGQRAPSIFTGQVRVGDPKALVANVDRASKLGFTAGIDLATGMHLTADWLKQAVLA